MATAVPSSQSTFQDRVSRSVVIEGHARILERMK
jgi:hypothetical protein